MYRFTNCLFKLAFKVSENIPRSDNTITKNTQIRKNEPIIFKTWPYFFSDIERKFQGYIFYWTILE